MRIHANLIKNVGTELLKKNIFENCTEVAKYSYDEFLSDEFLKDFPMVGSFVKAGKVLLSIPDKLLMIKLLYSWMA